MSELTKNQIDDLISNINWYSNNYNQRIYFVITSENFVTLSFRLSNSDLLINRYITLK